MSRPEALGHDLVAAALAGTGWRIDDDVLHLSVELPTFAAALGFVVSVGALAERRDHHPDIDLRFRTVRLVLSTHDVGALTELDVDLALAISALGDQTLSDRAASSGGWRQSTQ